MIKLGDGEIAHAIEMLLSFAKAGMKQVNNSLVVITIMLMFLSFMVLVLRVVASSGDLSELIAKFLKELTFQVFLLFIMLNWYDHLNILGNVIEPLMFQKIPQGLFNFKVNGYPIFKNDGVLLNLDNVWQTLQEIPKIWHKTTGGFIPLMMMWVASSNLGAFFMTYAVEIFIYVLTILMFADVLKMIVCIHLLYIFSGVMFPLMAFNFFRESYGMAIINSMISSAVQYYFVFILLGFVTGFLEYLQSMNKIMVLIGMLFVIALFKAMMKKISAFASRL